LADWKMHFRITDIRNDTAIEYDRHPESRDLTLGVPHTKGWSIGPPGSGCQIELAENPESCKLCIFVGSHHRVLCGNASIVPEIWVQSPGSWNRAAVPFQEKHWERLEGKSLESFSRYYGNLYLQFDSRPFRLGNFIIETEGRSS
jgi:hypothetical protein